MELSEATIVLRNVQQKMFNEDLQLQSGRPLEANSKLLCLNLFLDERGLIRVGGRIRHSNVDYGGKHHIVLPQQHPVTELIILYEHLKQLRPGCENRLAAVRRNYWPLFGTSLVRKIVRKCVICFRTRPERSSPIMGDLPSFRVNAVRLFLNCGLDYCGPFYYKSGPRKNSPVQKAYAAIFVCSTTRAIHSELVTSLSTDAFISALKRLMVR